MKRGIKAVITGATACLLVACDDAPQHPTPADKSPHSPTDTYTAPKSENYFPKKRTITVPSTQQEHAAAITTLRMHSREDARYAEEVKLLTERYTELYPNDAAGVTAAAMCFIEGILLQPERYAGSDFDRALLYCTILEEIGQQSPSPALLRSCIQVEDYRKSDDEKATALQELATAAQTAQQQQDRCSAAYALLMLVNHCPAESKNGFAETYWQQADYAGAPFRALMAAAGGLSAESAPLILTQEAQYTLLHPENDARLQALLRAVIQHTTVEALLQAVGTGQERSLLLCELLRYTMEIGASHQNSSTALARDLEQIPEAERPKDAALLLAIYHAGHAEDEAKRGQALDACLQLTAATEVDRMLLAGALLTAEAGTPHREYGKELLRLQAVEASPAKARRALRTLGLVLTGEQKHNEADIVIKALQNVTQDAEESARIQQQLAEHALRIGNLNAAIDLYSQLQLQYLGTLHISVPACHSMIKLLVERNNPYKVDPTAHTITPSDKWYAWARGRDFLTSLDKNPELISATDDATRDTLTRLRQTVNELSIDYNVQTEERDRLNKAAGARRKHNK